VVAIIGGSLPVSNGREDWDRFTPPPRGSGWSLINRDDVAAVGGAELIGQIDSQIRKFLLIEPSDKE